MAGKKAARVDRVGHNVRRLAVRPDLLYGAVQRFGETGELPDEMRVAEAVLRRITDNARKLVMTPAERAGRIQVLLAGGTPDPMPGDVRLHLLHEAVFGDELQRLGARTVLKLAVAAGLDVTDEDFLADQPLPKHNAVGLHLLGFPDFLAVNPYKAQARRLFARFDELRERVDHEDPRWFRPIAEGSRVFAETGDLPPPGLVRDAVLADAELKALILHLGGVDVSARMAALDAVARADAPDREAAVAELQRVVRADLRA